MYVCTGIQKSTSPLKPPGGSQATVALSSVDMAQVYLGDTVTVPR